MSGRLYVPEALKGRNVLTDPVAIRWEVRFVRCFVRDLKNEAAIAAWDWGNECDCMAPCTPDELWCWGNTITGAIRAEDAARPVVSGLHGTRPEKIRFVGEVCDILCTHPYPAFTPHCDVDFIDSFRSAFQAAAETVFMSDIGRKTAFIEEIGSFGPTVTSDAVSADYARKAAWNGYAHDCRGFLWWCANDQTELLQTPYDWNSMERELGLLTPSGEAKIFLKAMGEAGRVMAANPLPSRRVDACVILAEEIDRWGVGYMSFLLAKQAGFDVEFRLAGDPLPESSLYLIPSVNYTKIIPRHRYYELLERVKRGATLYVSSGYSGIQPFGGFGVEIETVAQASGPARFMKPDGSCAFEIAREFAIRTGMASAEVLARDGEGRPLFTCAGYGKGKLIFLAAPLEGSLMDRPRSFGEGAPDYALIYRTLLERSGIVRQVTSPDPMVTLTEHPFSDGRLAVVAVNNASNERTVALTLPAGKPVVRVVNGSFSGGKLTIAGASGAILYFN